MIQGPVIRQQSRLPGLELLRWVAAICVLLFHIMVIFGLPPVFGRGYLGVDLFFMLSGYVMARSFAARPPITEPIGRFIADRYRRMWPMMALGGLIGLPLLHARQPALLPFLQMAIANLALVPVAFRHEAYPLNVPAWTILFILLGNLLHRLVMYRWRMTALAAAIAGSAVAMGAVAAHAGSFDVGARPDNMVLAVPRLSLSYLIGIAVQRNGAVAAGLPLPPVLGLIAMPVLLAGAWWYGVTSWPFDLGFVMIACPLIIAGAGQLPAGTAGSAFAGEWSFPLYAIHFPLLIRLRNAGLGPWQAGPVVLALSALVAWADARLRAKAKARSGRATISRPGDRS